jgi:hypothetical protein
MTGGGVDIPGTSPKAFSEQSQVRPLLVQLLIAQDAPPSRLSPASHLWSSDGPLRIQAGAQPAKITAWKKGVQPDPHRHLNLPFTLIPFSF